MADEVQARLEHDPVFLALAEQYLTDWHALLDLLDSGGLVPDGAEARLMARLSATEAT
ncbi:hypothetical protein [Deinococcus radiotolerans]|uniref:Uncharacterized protein n=1 Tax=Deinococcus radiotolerans TaxID=1309407 RepID=A0ABQ2FQY1_9DEIO|nr:hypothetical protein [Deinococcus radiotolerans]GGL18197.1 hypothetical protein GCM10010844_41310 [Deinococcus radiotolerans]